MLPLGAFCEFSSATGLARVWSPSHHWSPVALSSLLRSFSHGEWHRGGQFLCEPHCEHGQEALLCDKIQSHHFWVLTWGLYHPPSAARLSPAGFPTTVWISHFMGQMVKSILFKYWIVCRCKSSIGLTCPAPLLRLLCHHLRSVCILVILLCLNLSKALSTKPCSWAGAGGGGGLTLQRQTRLCPLSF